MKRHDAGRLGPQCRERAVVEMAAGRTDRERDAHADSDSRGTPRGDIAPAQRPDPHQLPPTNRPDSSRWTADCRAVQTYLAGSSWCAPGFSAQLRDRPDNRSVRPRTGRERFTSPLFGTPHPASRRRARLSTSAGWALATLVPSAAASDLRPDGERPVVIATDRRRRVPQPSRGHHTSDTHEGTPVGRTGGAVPRDTGAARGRAQNESRTTLAGRKRDCTLEIRRVHLAAGNLGPVGDNPGAVRAHDLDV